MVLRGSEESWAVEERGGGQWGWGAERRRAEDRLRGGGEADLPLR